MGKRKVVLTPMDLFNTPASVKELEQYVTGIPNDQERIIAVLIMGMTWNLCAKLTAEHG